MKRRVSIYIEEDAWELAKSIARKRSVYFDEGLSASRIVEAAIRRLDLRIAVTCTLEAIVIRVAMSGTQSKQENQRVSLRCDEATMGLHSGQAVVFRLRPVPQTVAYSRPCHAMVRSCSRDAASCR